MGIEGVDPAKSIMYLYLAVGLGDFAVGWLSERLKSRKKTFFIFVGITLFFVLLFFMQRGGEASSFYLLCAGMGFGAGFNVVYMTMGVEQFGTNLRASAAISIPNMIRGALPLIILLFKFMRTTFNDYLTGAWVTGAILFAVAIVAAWFMKETHGKDLDFLEV
jgi:MFS family permease